MSDEQPSVISKIANGAPSRTSQSKLWAVIAFFIGLPIWFGLGRFEPAVVAEAAGYSTMVIVFIGWLFWPHLSRRWFWVFMTAIVALHALLVCTAPWPSHYKTGKGDTVFLVADVILMIGLGTLVERLTGKSDGKA